MLYLWLKAFHIIFVIAWMGGLLIYPRYKIHQLSSAPGEPLFDTLSDASNRLRRIIMTPAIVLVWVFGIAMVVSNPGLLSAGWLYAKLLLVLVMSGVHGYFIALGRRIDSADAGGAGDKAAPTGRTMRMLNEVPFLLMIVIVILVVVRPF